jgi:hypothetical protein
LLQGSFCIYSLHGRTQFPGKNIAGIVDPMLTLVAGPSITVER